MNINFFLALFGAIILLGFLGQYFFRLTKVPVPVILLLAGIALSFLDQPVGRSLLFTVAPYFGTFALILILFEGGLEIEFLDMVRQSRGALFLGSLYFLFCAAGTYFMGIRILHLSPEISVLLGLILAGSSPGILMPTISQLSISKEMKAHLALETNFTELLTVIGSLIYLEFLEGGKGLPGFGVVLTHFLVSLSVALVFALVAGVLWSRFMGLFSKEPLAYMLTLGLLCLLYSGTQWMGGKGSLAVLFFGLILGNAPWLASRSLKFLKRWFALPLDRESFLVDEVIKKINQELSFLVRTFFFVFLGFLFDFSSFGPKMGLTVLGLVCWFFLSRWIVCRFLYKGGPLFRELPPSLHLAMIPRGLGNAVVAFLAFDLGMPGFEKVPSVVLGVILGTNLVMALLVYRSEKELSIGAPGILDREAGSQP